VRSYLSGGTGRNAPLSEYLLETLIPHFLRINADKETISQAFDRFECLVSLEYGNKRMGALTQKTFQMHDDINGFEVSDMPMGRYGWRYKSKKIVTVIRKEYESDPRGWEPLRAGLCKGDPFRFKILIKKLEGQISQIGF
jgi:hypothetical protein